MEEDLRYPVGRFRRTDRLSAVERAACIETLEKAPWRLRDAVAGLDDGQLDTPYREGGWSVRQVVHHLADSHLNAYIRLRLTLTEEAPTIRPYDENAWASLADAREAPVEPSLSLLDGLHERWTRLLVSLDEAEFTRAYLHPETGPGTVDTLVALYEWHCRHHTAHVTGLRLRRGW